MLRSKAAGEPLPEPEEEATGEVVDLIAALRESVEQHPKEAPLAHSR